MREARIKVPVDSGDAVYHCITRVVNGERLLDEPAREVLNFAMGEMHFSPRAHDRILKVARTIADMDGSETVRPNDLHEALQYRSLDRAMWG